MSTRDQSDAASVQSRSALPEELEGIVDVNTLDTKNYHYRFIQERPQNMARKKAKGYVPVLAEDEGVELLAGEVSPDGVIRDGDSVLMRVPKDRFRQRRKQIAKFTEDRLTAPVQRFKQKTKKAGPGGKDIKVDSDED